MPKSQGLPSLLIRLEIALQEASGLVLQAPDIRLLPVGGADRISNHKFNRLDKVRRCQSFSVTGWRRHQYKRDGELFEIHSDALRDELTQYGRKGLALLSYGVSWFKLEHVR